MREETPSTEKQESTRESRIFKISEFIRKNGDASITEISRETGIPERRLYELIHTIQARYKVTEKFCRCARTKLYVWPSSKKKK